MSYSTYQRLAVLQGPQDAILSVAFSPDGKFVAAAGYSGIIVWNLSTNNSVTVPQVPYNPRQTKYVFTASSWLRFEVDNQLVLLLGSLRGDILVWNWNAENQEFKRSYQVPPRTKDMGILAIDVYQAQVPAGKRGRVVVAAADRSVRAFSLSATGQWDTVFSITLEEGFLPRAVRFRKGTRVIFAFSRTGGGVIQLDRTTGVILSHKTCAPDIMASVCLHPNDFFAACTGRDFQMFKLSTLELVCTFEGENPIVRYSKHAVFTEDGRLLIGGTDRGCAIVYDVGYGTSVQTLEYPRGGLVQHVTALTLDDRHLIAIAGSTLQESADVIVFQKQIAKQVLPAASSGEASTAGSPPQNLRNATSSSPHNDSIYVGFRIQKISLWTFFRNSVIFALMLFGIYSLVQEYMPLLVEMGRKAFTRMHVIEEVDGVVVIPKIIETPAANV